METWTCTAHGFGPEELQFLRHVFAAEHGWLKKLKRVHIVESLGSGHALERSFTITKTSGALMSLLFPQTYLRGLSVTNMSAVPRAVYINAANWSRIPQGSEYTDLAMYREALVNHEVAHVFGYGHVGCSAPGLPSDVRQQPSKSLQGCLPTPAVYLR
jgi:hypothetical protein